MGPEQVYPFRVVKVQDAPLFDPDFDPDRPVILAVLTRHLTHRRADMMRWGMEHHRVHPPGSLAIVDPTGKRV